ncbi:MAG: hypothetical protein OXC26_02975 [Albidovulum sp.]|nr:hypothetical protein [Albidovulum sp.]
MPPTLAILDDLDQFLQGPAKVLQAGDAQAVARPGEVSWLALDMTCHEETG